MSENPIRLLRLALGLTQQKFAALLDVSYSSIQQYEAGRRPARDVLDKLRGLALQHRLGDLAVLFSDDDARPASPAIPSSGDRPGDATNYRQLLDEIFASGSQDAISAVKQNLIVFLRLVRADAARSRAKERRG